MKLKSFCTTKEMHTHRVGENIFQVYIKQRTRICRKLKKLNSSTINEPMKKCATELNRIFSKEEVQIAKKKKKTHGKNANHPWP
jgi:hypothetical protein